MSPADATDQLHEHLKRLIRPQDNIRVSPGDESFFWSSQLHSNCNGLPYFEADEKWPINLHTRRPLDFVFQLVNHGDLHLPANMGVLQFFYDWDVRPQQSRAEGWLIKTYTDFGSCIPLNPPRRSARQVCKLNFVRGYSLPAWETIERHDIDIPTLCRQISPYHPWEAYDHAKHRLLGQHETSSFIGPYPQWLQGDATPSFGNYRPRLVVQFDSYKQWGIEWAKQGSLYLFHHPMRATEHSFVVQSS